MRVPLGDFILKLVISPRTFFKMCIKHSPNCPLSFILFLSLEILSLLQVDIPSYNLLQFFITQKWITKLPGSLLCVQPCTSGFTSGPKWKRLADRFKKKKNVYSDW